MTEGNGDKLAPPYASWKTFTSFVEDCKANDIPGRIDASVLKKLSGTVRNHLTSALKSLNLISGDGTPLDTFRTLVEAYKTDKWQSALANTLRTAYAPILGSDFDVRSATPAQMKERFHVNGGIEGETIERAIRFYLSGLRDAGIPFSARLQLRERAPRGAPRRASQPKRDGKTLGREGGNDSFEGREGTLKIPFDVIDEEGGVSLETGMTEQRWEKINQYVKTVLGLRAKSGQ